MVMYTLSCSKKTSAILTARQWYLRKAKVISGLFQYLPAKQGSTQRNFIYLLVFFFNFFWLYHMTCKILVRRPGIEPYPL